MNTIIKKQLQLASKFMTKKLSNQQTIGAVLKQVIEANNLQPGLDQVVVREVWRNIMGNGVNNYTKNVSFKNNTLYVELTSSVLREELSLGKSKIIKIINEELHRDVLKDVVLR